MNAEKEILHDVCSDFLNQRLDISLNICFSRGAQQPVIERTSVAPRERPKSMAPTQGGNAALGLPVPARKRLTPSNPNPPVGGATGIVIC